MNYGNGDNDYKKMQKYHFTPENKLQSESTMGVKLEDKEQVMVK